MRDTGLAQRLRDAGLRVVECAGWQTHGADTFNPIASVNHHTAAGGIGLAPSLGAIINGKPGVNGPLANVLQSRERDGQDDIFYVAAAGRANHAGVGDWRGVTGNSRAWGLEIEHDGVSPLSERRQRLAARCHAAMIRLRHTDSGWVCQHREWAKPPGRKIDAATGVDANTFRGYVASYLAGSPPTQPPAPNPVYEYSEDAVKSTVLHIGRLDNDGRGWGDWDPQLGRDPIIVGLSLQGPSPPDDGGYWYTDSLPIPSAQPRGGKVRVSIVHGKPGATVGVNVSVA